MSDSDFSSEHEPVDDSTPTVPAPQPVEQHTEPPPTIRSAPKLDLDQAQELVGNRYRMESVAGQGGMGRVFTAHDQRLDRRVAIKFLTGPLQADARERLLSEARAMAGIRHPGIAPVHEVVCDVDIPYLVMGWIDGIEMDVAWRSMNLDQRIEMVDQVITAVSELHDVGLVHLDIKPCNILVDRFNTPVLVDFGLARSAANTPGTSSGGTPGYAAPEQFSGESTPGPAADVHAIGVLLFQAMTDQLPWAGDSTAALLKAAMQEPPRIAEELAPGAPWPLQRIAMAALERSPARRYPDARNIRLDLLRYQRGEMVAARPSQLTTQFSEQVRQRQEETEVWNRQGLITQREATQLGRIYERIQRPESHWIVDSRRLTISQVTLYLGGWVVLLAMTIGLGYGWQTLEETTWLRWAIPGGIALGILSVAMTFLQRQHPRLALAYLFTACILLPIAVAIFLEDMHWFSATRDSLDTQCLSVILDVPPIISNINLLISAATLTLLSLVSRHLLCSSAFAILAVIGSIISVTAGWSTTGLMTDSQTGWASLGLVLLMSGIAMLATGIPLNRRQQAALRMLPPGHGHLLDAWALLSGGVITMVAALTLLAWNVPEWYLPGLLESASPAYEGSSEMVVDPQSRSIAFILNGLLLTGLSWLLGSAKTTACQRLSDLLRWIIPAHILGGLLALEADTDSVAAAWVWISVTALASLCFTVASVRRQWRPFVVSGLIGLAWSFVLMLSDLKDQLAADTFDTVIIGIIIGVPIIGIGIMILAGWLSNREQRMM
ncbi:MAG: serine/threonine protein kinase [Phycisphaerales bacterium]|nr:serine/threonine protein kinase [Phycisphaerales bacterium]